MEKREKTKLITSIGGQALMEGIMMRGPKKTAIAVRRSDGEILLEEMEPLGLGKKAKILRVPIIRGIVNMIDSFGTGYKALMRSAELAVDDVEETPEEEMSKFEKWIDDKFGDKFLKIFMGIAMVISIAFCVALFFFVPTWLFNLLQMIPNSEWLGSHMIYRSVFEGFIRILLFLGYMALCLLNKDVRRLYKYHGAEHKTIFCYEYGLDLTVENVMKQRRFHPRCGTSFIIIILILGIFVGCFIPFTNPFIRTLTKVLCIPLVVGLGYELIKVCGRHDNIITRIISAPGMWMQHLTTKEPDPDMAEVAIKAMQYVIPENGEDRIG